MDKLYTLIGRDGRAYESRTPGLLGGYSRKEKKIYGRLDCASAKRWIEKGHYVEYRVFFSDEGIAKDAGYRPCARCLPNEYKAWKERQSPQGR